MSYQFFSTNKSQYFVRSGDLVFHNSEHFLLKIKPLIDEDLAYDKFFVGFVINRKVGDSVLRNKVKRRLRVIFNSKDFLFHKNFCYIIIAKPSISQLSFEELKFSIFYSLSVSFSNCRFVKFTQSSSTIKF